MGISSLARVTLAIGIGLTGSAWAATPNHFVSQASAAGMAEIEASELALEKSQSAEIKAFARQMVQDHREANAELAELATKLNIDIPVNTQQTTKARDMLNEVQSGTLFNAAYVDNQLKAHEEAVRLFTEQSQSTSEKQELVIFAKNTLPRLKHHLEMAKVLQREHPKND